MEFEKTFLFMDDVIAAKVAAIERCLRRVEEESCMDWKLNFTHQDALILNLQRACQTAIDAASYVVRKRKLGIPTQSREVFSLLEKAGLITFEMADRLRRMVGFQNAALHEYSNVNLEIIDRIIKNDLQIMKAYTAKLLQVDTTDEH